MNILLNIKCIILKYKLLLICTVIILLIGSIGFLFYLNPIEKEVIEEKQELEVKEEIVIVEENYFYVDIKGAIKNPGVYKMIEGDLIIDVINKAGGLLKTADTSVTNLAYKITNGLSFKIYTKEEVITLNTPPVITESCICPTETNQECITTVLTNIEEESIETLISINTALKNDLILLNGVGEITANKIIVYREENGNFEKIEDIMNVSGIGESLFAKIKDYITI